MSRRRGFFAELQHQSAVADRNRRQAQAAAVRDQARTLAARERARKAEDRARAQQTRGDAAARKAAEAQLPEAVRTGNRWRGTGADFSPGPKRDLFGALHPAESRLPLSTVSSAATPDGRSRQLCRTS
jgi:hypothetical protein